LLGWIFWWELPEIFQDEKSDDDVRAASLTADLDVHRGAHCFRKARSLGLPFCCSENGGIG
jgi:hypothetical protein